MFASVGARRRVALPAALVMMFIMAPTGANAARQPPKHKVTLCHRTGSYSNPYRRITVAVNGVQFRAHDGHDGPVFYPGFPKHQKWGDIIPPFDFGPNATYPGKNWNDAGKAIFYDGCAIASPPTTTTSTSSSTSTTTTTVVTGDQFFQVEFRDCHVLHVGYERFPPRTVVHWKVYQSHKLFDVGQFVTPAARGYHFGSMRLARRFAMPPRKAEVRFSWKIRGTAYTYFAYRATECG